MTPRLLGQRHTLCASRRAKAELDCDGERYPVMGEVEHHKLWDAALDLQFLTCPVII
jgi:hypothetical protein